MAQQTIDLPTSYYRRQSAFVDWRPPDNSRPAIIDGLKASSSDSRFFSVLRFFPGGLTRLGIDSSQTGSQSADLSGEFEKNGAIDITISGTTYSFDLNSSDLTEPYIWTPSNSTDAGAIFTTLARSRVAATLVIRDGPPVSGFKMVFGGKTYSKVQFGGKTYNKMVFNGKTY